MAALSALLIFWCALVAAMPAYAQTPAKTPTKAPEKTLFRPDDPLNAQAFDHFYNMDYDRSIQEFDQILKRHPDDPFAVNHLLTAVLVRELYKTGAMNTGEYTNDSFIGQVHRPPDPAQKERIKQLVEQAQKIEQETKVEMAKAVQKQGFTPQAYTQILATVNGDNTLSKKALELIQKERAS